MPDRPIELRPLRYFLAVAEAGQFTLAAAHLGIQQPPLSQQIQALERQLGLSLFERHPKGVRLTDAGRVLAGEARRLVDDADALQARMRSIARGDQGRLRLAFTSSAAAHAFTPQTLRECRLRLPGVVLTIVGERNAAEVSEDLLAGRLHAGFLREPVEQTEALATLTLLTEPMVVAVPRDHGLAARRRLALADFDGQPMILVRRPGGHGLYGRLLARCAQEGVTPAVVAEVERMMSGLNLVAAGVGLCLVPASMQGAHAQAIVYRPLVRSAGLDAPLTLVWRTDRCHGALARFVDLVKALAAERP
jgi:DNA-binding transcriptional LysR family regulator